MEVAALAEDGHAFTADTFVSGIGGQVNSEGQPHGFRLMVDHLFGAFLFDDAVHPRFLVLFNQSAGQIVEVQLEGKFEVDRSPVIFVGFTGAVRIVGTVRAVGAVGTVVDAVVVDFFSCVLGLLGLEWFGGGFGKWMFLEELQWILLLILMIFHFLVIFITATLSLHR